MAVFGDAGSFLKDLAAVCRFLGKNLIDSALSDVGVALAPETGVHQKLVNIAQTRGLFVDIVLALAGAVVPAGDHDLRRLHRERPVLIVQNERRFRVADCRALQRTAENDVLHLCSAQRLGALLAHDPADGV